MGLAGDEARGALRLVTLLLLLGIGLAIQLHFFAAYPQPALFGDPRGYYEAGQRFLSAVARWRVGESFASSFESVRGLFYLLGVGSLFAVVDAIRPGDFAFFRMVLAGFNAVTMLGVFLLARRLSGTDRGGFIALALAVVYPAFSVQTGRLYPDPVTGCFFVLSSWLYLEAVIRRHAGLMVAAGLTLVVAILVRSQLALYVLAATPLVLAVSAPRWARTADGRRLALALVVSLLPLGLAWVGIQRAVGSRDDVIRLGNLTFHQPYPYGFWQFLDGDGWSTAYRWKSEPFYFALVRQNEAEPGFMRSRARMLAFTARWVAARPLESAGVVLNNVYRLLDRPANDYKWDYPLAYPVQVLLQRAVVVAALAGIALFAAESLSWLGAFFIPLSLVLLHGLTFVWPRYNVPIMPILIAAAGAAVARLIGRAGNIEKRDEEKGVGALPTGPVLLRRAVIVAVAIVVAVALAGVGTSRMLALLVPDLARWLRLAGTLAGLAVPFLLASALAASRRARLFSGIAWTALGLVVTTHALRDDLWHEHTLPLGGATAGVEQAITLSAEAVDRLLVASEAFVVFDLQIARGDTAGIGVEVGGRRYPGSALRPTMPRLPESTSTGGRDWRGYPQWWALALDRSLLPRGGGTLTVRLSVDPPSEASLRLDRFGDQREVYEGPSFGERPRMVALKLEYDGDYRVQTRYPLRSQDAVTSMIDRSGARHDTRAVARIRLLTLDRNEGSLLWRTTPAPAERTAFAFFAETGFRDEAILRVDGGTELKVPLDRTDDWVTEAGSWRLCRRSLGMHGNNPTGAFVLIGPTGKGQPVELAVSFRTGLSERPMLFVLDRRRDFAEAAPHFAACGVAPGVARASGVGVVVNATRNAYPADTGYWTVRDVF
jgi:Dolichyl-phosphate-mannose-protein mannosyltransferase